jgi:G3E family GTPase
MATDLFILAGFLGAGKTTTLGHVLSTSTDLAGTMVIVNEAGRLGLDGRIVEKSGVPVRELNNGCVCCTLKTELVDLLRRLLSENVPRRILIEASGLANPLAVVETVRRFVDDLGLIKTVLILDAEIWEIRSVLGEAFQQGLGAADLLLLNKTEILDQSELEALTDSVRTEVPGPELFCTSFGRIPPDLFFQPPPQRPAEACGGQDEIWAGRPVPQALDGFITVNHHCVEPVAPERWANFLFKWAGCLHRIKGQLVLSDGPVYFDSVRGANTYRPALSGVEGTSLVLIGRDFDEAELQADLGKLK